MENRERRLLLSKGLGTQLFQRPIVHSSFYFTAEWNPLGKRLGWVLINFTFCLTNLAFACFPLLVFFVLVYSHTLTTNSANVLITTPGWEVMKKKKRKFSLFLKIDENLLRRLLTSSPNNYHHLLFFLSSQLRSKIRSSKSNPRKSRRCALGRTWPYSAG